MSNAVTSTLTRACSVCAKTDFADWLRPAQSPGPVVRCKHCGFVLVNPVETTKALIQDGPVLEGHPQHLTASSNLEDIRGTWEEPLLQAHLRELPAKKENARAILRHIHAFAKTRGTLLDFGCGVGGFLTVAAEMGWDCYGIEPLIAPAICARGMFGLSVITDTLHHDSYPPEFFDVVTAFQVFEHLIHPEQEFEKIRRILKPGGLVVVEVPNIETLGVKLMGARHRHFVQDHVSFFSARTLGRLMERMGFQIKRVLYPSRVMSARHLLHWIAKYQRATAEYFGQHLPVSLLEKNISVNLGDIVTVIAEKQNPRVAAS